MPRYTLDWQEGRGAQPLSFTASYNETAFGILLDLVGIDLTGGKSDVEDFYAAGAKELKKDGVVIFPPSKTPWEWNGWKKKYI
ncbi:MAG: hypothetical protein AAB536_02215 [Patescibacteria group bacterium]